MGLKYSDIVDYDKLDPFKEECVRRFQRTLALPNRLGVSIVPESIGLTAVAIDLGRVSNFGDFYIAFGVEGLGTKNMIAETMAEQEKIGRGIGLEERAIYSGFGQCEMACSLNDLSAIGATVIAFEPIVATGSSDYFSSKDKVAGIIDGFERGAQIAEVAIPGGETPTLKGVVFPNTVDVAGGSLGIIQPKRRLTTGNRLEPNLVIYGIGSSGIMANGVSLARKIAESQKDGYFTKLPSGRTIGEALLNPMTIYAPFVDTLFGLEADVRFMQPITGHGWAKIMRHKSQLKYLIDNVPDPQEEFKFMQQAGPVTDEEAYRAWNMSVGMVVIAPERDSSRIKKAGEANHLPVYELGHTESGEREVIIVPKNIGYKPR